MATSTRSSSSLDLTISVQGFSVPLQASSVIRDLDINQVPTGGGEQDQDQEYCMDDTEDDCTNGAGPPRKKLRLTKEQSRLLEESFRHNHTLNTKQKEALAMELKLRPRQVEVWFQNRRARSKLKQTEIECEYLKRWFGSLTEQNRRLHREVEELRALKVGPPTVNISGPGHPGGGAGHPVPASSLSMCPRCERVSSTALSLDNKSPSTTPLSSNPSTSP